MYWCKRGTPFRPFSNITTLLFSSVQLLSCVWLFVTPWTATCQASLSITNSRSLPKLMSIELVMPSNHLLLCRPLLLPPSIFPSIMVFSNESVLGIRWPKYWSFSLSPSNEYSGLTSFRMNWLDLLAVQETLKTFLPHHSSKTSILWHSYYHYIKKFNDPFFFGPSCTTCGISVPWPRFEPRLQQRKH